MLNALADLLERRTRLADRPMALKVAAAPALILILFILLAASSTAALLLTGRSVQNIVNHDMRDVARLNAVATDFQEAQSSLDRLLVAKAALQVVDVSHQTEMIRTRLHHVHEELATFRTDSDAQHKSILLATINDVDRYAAAVDVVASMLEVDFATSATMLAPFRVNASRVEQRLNRVAADGVARANASAARTVFRSRLFLIVLLIAVLLAALTSLFIAYVVGRATVNSITGIATATAAVMNEGEIDLQTFRRGDELGSVVAALEAFDLQRGEKRRLELQTAALRHQAHLDQQRRVHAVGEVREQAERERQQTMAELACAFDQKLAALIRSAQQAMVDLESDAIALDETAHRNSRFAKELDDIASLFAEEMKDARQAAETLAHTFIDIDRAVAGTSSVARSVSDHALSAREAVARSHEKAAAIEQIVDVIAAIGRQTNLLALNATIEATRVGHAGAGFAVVAAEIKSLSGRTASSTGDVRRQIETVQQHIGEVVRSTDGLSALIASMDDVSGQVAEMSRGQAGSTEQLDRLITQAHERSSKLAAASSSIEASAQRNIDAVQRLRQTGHGLASTLQTLALDAQAFTRQITSN